MKIAPILLWLGLTLIVAIVEILKITAAALVPGVLVAGAIIMFIGVILLILDR